MKPRIVKPAKSGGSVGADGVSIQISSCSAADLQQWLGNGGADLIRTLIAKSRGVPASRIVLNSVTLAESKRRKARSGK
jgi:hypothetical protein